MVVLPPGHKAQRVQRQLELGADADEAAGQRLRGHDAVVDLPVVVLPGKLDGDQVGRLVRGLGLLLMPPRVNVPPVIHPPGLLLQVEPHPIVEPGHLQHMARPGTARQGTAGLAGSVGHEGAGSVHGMAQYSTAGCLRLSHAVAGLSLYEFVIVMFILPYTNTWLFIKNQTGAVQQPGHDLRTQLEGI